MNYIFDLILNIPPDLYEGIRSYFAFWLERFSSNNWLIGILLLFPLFIIVTFITGLFWMIMVAMGLAAISFFIFGYFFIIIVVIMGIYKLLGISKKPTDIPIISDILSFLTKIFDKLEASGGEAFDRVYGNDTEIILEKIAFLHENRLINLKLFSNEEYGATHKYFYKGYSKQEMLKIILANPYDTMQKIQKKYKEIPSSRKSFYEKEIANGNLEKWFQNLVYDIQHK